ncbi:hypothetical protein T07_8151 [Trichinella nelsoni]|uniref:Uncharacterized protein n=1 Tax=Trichinella nelsoni TaxID=6336 RepID=A0A0V0SBK4_9BILA|nr:hypothetical protein T07_8151 [Trichinella nelsoni]
MEDEKLSSCILMKKSSNSSIFMYPVAFNKKAKKLDQVSLYLTPLAFSAPTGGNAPCKNMFGMLSTISNHYKI